MIRGKSNKKEKRKRSLIIKTEYDILTVKITYTK